MHLQPPAQPAPCLNRGDSAREEILAALRQRPFYLIPNWAGSRAPIRASANAAEAARSAALRSPVRTKVNSQAAAKASPAPVVFTIEAVGGRGHLVQPLVVEKDGASVTPKRIA